MRWLGTCGIIFLQELNCHMDHAYETGGFPSKLERPPRQLTSSNNLENDSYMYVLVYLTGEMIETSKTMREQWLRMKFSF